ncbi:MAG: hypothetical protein EZS28_012525 [Streblomastix strix]|uniref:Protein kinase domain-containing protein n=1 Tax=Streblomastix strix TaxID=222440 RepID=A0A5J4WAZ0_9EUKA|nr:MAG: hypothetical protein EZS28_012525 [Streblomastix strix]
MIGKGGFGRVYEVWRPGTGVIGAKVMKEEDFETKEWRVGFQLTKIYKSICIEVPFCNDVLDSDSHFDGVCEDEELGLPN